MWWSKKEKKSGAGSLSVQQDAASKLNDWTVSDLGPRSLAALKESTSSGHVDQLEQLFRTMCAEWDTLKKDLNDVSKAVASLSWSVAPWAESGQAPSEEAHEAARMVDAALWHAPSIAPGEWKHNFLELVESVVYAMYRGQTVHEILWESCGKLVFPAAYVPILPQFFGWSISNGEPDRLLLFPDGIWASDSARPFDRNKFIVAINKSGIDHPLFNASLRTLVGWFGASRWGLTWLMQYCQVFGLPIRHFIIDDEEIQRKLEAELSRKGASTTIFSSSAARLEIHDAMKGSSSLPTATLIEMADRACDKLILGQTLTSDTGKGGSGAYALGKVHQGIRLEIITHAAQFVANVLNAQLVPAIVELNMGRVSSPLPEIVFSVPNSDIDKDKLDFYDGMINRLGMRLSEQRVYDAFGQPMPQEGERVFEPLR